MTQEELHKEVVLEADLIKQHATKKQIDNLNVDELNGSESSTCIYGQMTGHCFNYEASKLIHKCAKAVSSELLNEDGCLENTFNPEIDSITVDKPWKFKETIIPAKDQGNPNRYFSAIELYIILPGSNNNELIEYIKGERESFKP